MYRTKKYYEADKQYYINKSRERTARIREMVDDIKDVPCVDCGIKYPPYVMDFDHTSDDKVDHISRMVKRGSISNILQEIAKCDIVCSNCHRMRTHGRKVKAIPKR